MKNILIIEYGTGNCSSLEEAFRRSTGTNPSVGLSPELIINADGIVLPGVGNFDCAMKRIQKRDCFHVLREKIEIKKTPVLGICLGMHLLGSKSDEGNEKGLDFIDGHVSKLVTGGDTRKAPHVGWTSIDLVKSNPMFKAQVNNFYFLHNYKFVCHDRSNIVATVSGYNSINAIIQKDNIFGVQFHPEKSLKDGDKLLEKFLETC